MYVKKKKQTQYNIKVQQRYTCAGSQCIAGIGQTLSHHS